MNNIHIIISELTDYNTIFLQFFLLFAIFCAVRVIINKNTIVSILFLIGLFVNVACILALLGLNFLGSLYLLLSALCVIIILCIVFNKHLKVSTLYFFYIIKNIKLILNKPVNISLKGLHMQPNDYNRFGTGYIVFGLFFGFLGIFLSLLIRLELFDTNVQFVADNPVYNGTISMCAVHATFMMVFMVMPVLVGFVGNFLLPLTIGGPKAPLFDELDSISWYLLIASSALFLLTGVLYISANFVAEEINSYALSDAFSNTLMCLYYKVSYYLYTISGMLVILMALSTASGIVNMCLIIRDYNADGLEKIKWIINVLNGIWAFSIIFFIKCALFFHARFVGLDESNDCWYDFFTLPLAISFFVLFFSIRMISKYPYKPLIKSVDLFLSHLMVVPLGSILGTLLVLEYIIPFFIYTYCFVELLAFSTLFFKAIAILYNFYFYSNPGIVSPGFILIVSVCWTIISTVSYTRNNTSSMSIKLIKQLVIDSFDDISIKQPNLHFAITLALYFAPKVCIWLSIFIGVSLSISYMFTYGLVGCTMSIFHILEKVSSGTVNLLNSEVIPIFKGNCALSSLSGFLHNYLVFINENQGYSNLGTTGSGSNQMGNSGPSNPGNNSYNNHDSSNSNNDGDDSMPIIPNRTAISINDIINTTSPSINNNTLGAATPAVAAPIAGSSLSGIAGVGIATANSPDNSAIPIYSLPPMAMSPTLTLPPLENLPPLNSSRFASATPEVKGRICAVILDIIGQSEYCFKSRSVAGGRLVEYDAWKGLRFTDFSDTLKSREDSLSCLVSRDRYLDRLRISLGDNANKANLRSIILVQSGAERAQIKTAISNIELELLGVPADEIARRFSLNTNLKILNQRYSYIVNRDVNALRTRIDNLFK